MPRMKYKYSKSAKFTKHSRARYDTALESTAQHNTADSTAQRNTTQPTAQHSTRLIYTMYNVWYHFRYSYRKWHERSSQWVGYHGTSRHAPKYSQSHWRMRIWRYEFFSVLVTPIIEKSWMSQSVTAMMIMMMVVIMIIIIQKTIM